MKLLLSIFIGLTLASAFQFIDPFDQAQQHIDFVKQRSSTKLQSISSSMELQSQEMRELCDALYKCEARFNEKTSDDECQPLISDDLLLSEDEDIQSLCEPLVGLSDSESSDVIDENNGRNLFNWETEEDLEATCTNECLGTFHSAFIGYVDCVLRLVPEPEEEDTSDMMSPGLMEDFMDLSVDLYCSQNQNGEYCVTVVEEDYYNSSEVAEEMESELEELDNLEEMCAMLSSWGCCTTTILNVMEDLFELMEEDSNDLEFIRSDYEECGITDTPACIEFGESATVVTLTWSLGGITFTQYDGLSYRREVEFEFALVKDLSVALNVPQVDITIISILESTTGGLDVAFQLRAGSDKETEKLYGSIQVPDQVDLTATSAYLPDASIEALMNYNELTLDNYTGYEDSYIKVFANLASVNARDITITDVTGPESSASTGSFQWRLQEAGLHFRVVYTTENSTSVFDIVNSTSFFDGSVLGLFNTKVTNSLSITGSRDSKLETLDVTFQSSTQPSVQTIDGPSDDNLSVAASVKVSLVILVSIILSLCL